MNNDEELEELIELAEEGYIVEMRLDETNDISIVITKKEEGPVTILTLEQEDYEAASDKVKTINDNFLNAKKELDKKLIGDQPPLEL